MTEIFLYGTVGTWWVRRVKLAKRVKSWADGYSLFLPTIDFTVYSVIKHVTAKKLNAVNCLVFPKDSEQCLILKTELENFGIQLVIQSHRLRMGEEHQGYLTALDTEILSVVFRLSDSLAFGSLSTGYVLLYNKSPHSIVYRLITFGGLPRQIFWFLAAFWFMFVKKSLLHQMHSSRTINHAPDPTLNGIPTGPMVDP